jgi:hypothetical protein
MTRAVALLSGGLDSTLAARLISDQGIEVLGVHFTHPLCSVPARPGREARSVVAFAASCGIKAVDAPMGDAFQEMVRRPRFGRGAGMNPCIDCHAFMLKRAAEMLPELGASFVVTGEVVGQRPMSQNRQALDLIERDTGLKGRLLRPLSALLMEPTEPEQSGTVDRSKLLDISGRGRDRQIALAASLGITGYPAPAGGCMLTDKNFSDRLKDAFAINEGLLPDAEIRILKYGRHFRLPSGAKVIIGRDSFENDRLLEAAPEKYARIVPENFPGPVALVDGGTEDLEAAAAAVLAMSPKAGAGASMTATRRGASSPAKPVAPFSIAEFRQFAIGAG